MKQTTGKNSAGVTFPAPPSGKVHLLILCFFQFLKPEEPFPELKSIISCFSLLDFYYHFKIQTEPEEEAILFSFLSKFLVTF